jgi:hypothetical protein
MTVFNEVQLEQKIGEGKNIIDVSPEKSIENK